MEEAAKLAAKKPTKGKKRVANRAMNSLSSKTVTLSAPKVSSMKVPTATANKTTTPAKKGNNASQAEKPTASKEKPEPNLDLPALDQKEDQSEIVQATSPSSSLAVEIQTPQTQFDHSPDAREINIVKEEIEGENEED